MGRELWKRAATCTRRFLWGTVIARSSASFRGENASDREESRLQVNKTPHNGCPLTAADPPNKRNSKRHLSYFQFRYSE